MPKKIKILVCGILPPPNFGHSMMYKMLMESSFVKEHEITFLDMKFWSYAQHKKVTVAKILKMLKYWWQFVVLIMLRRPKYVLVNMSFDKMPFLKDYLYCVTGWILGRKIILHDMGQYLPELHGSCGPFLKRLLNHLLSFTSGIIVMGEKVRQDYAPYYDVKRIIVVPGSVEDTEGISVSVQKTERIEVLYFSYLSVSKGLWTALRSIPMVIKANPNIHFTFGGPIESPQLQKDMEDYLAREGLNGNVTYIGYVGDVAERTRRFRQADIFIFPTHRDVFGLVLLHAMAERIPVVASIEGTIPEIIEDGVNGLLFEKGNEAALAQNILKLAANESLRRQMGTANRNKYEACYSPQVYGQLMAEAFQKIDLRETGHAV